MDIGRTHLLEIMRLASPGAYLKDGEGNEVLLPTKYIPVGTQVGNKLDVFVYKDSEDRLIATTLVPHIQVNEFGYLKAKEISKSGAFLDWGIQKDLLVPFREQIGKMKGGNSYLVYLYLDKKTNRLVATQKIKKYFEKGKVSLEEGDEVGLLIGENTDLGTKVIIENRYEGLLFENEIFDDLLVGERARGYIKKIRPDKKMDVSLQKQGIENIEAGTQKILKTLEENSGFLSLTDKSAPEDIQLELQMSKKNFKRSVGMLYKQRRIGLEPKGIRKLA